MLSYAGRKTGLFPDKKKHLTGGARGAIICQVKRLDRGESAVEDRMMQSMLLDFYGELLTERQRSCYDLHVNEDLSLSEIAEQCGISRQGVWDNIRRAEQALREIEEKTGLVRRFTALRQGLASVERQVEAIEQSSSGELRLAAQEVLRRLRELEE